MADLLHCFTNARRCILLGIALTGVFFCGCRQSQPTASTTPESKVVESLGDRPGLHNVFRISERLYSGSSPEGDAGFETLKSLAVKTIISVDGAKPEVESAHRFGMKYVHLPVGYDGVPRETAIKIAKAIRDLPGPVYIHCHHGKHRGPAAAMAAQRCLDPQCQVADAVAFLKKAGTDPQYKGLFAAVDSSQPATASEWEKAGNEFPESATVSDLVKTMVEIDDLSGKLKQSAKGGWKSPNESAHDAKLLMEQFRELARRDDIRKREREFLTILEKSEKTAMELENGLRAMPINSQILNISFASGAEMCAKCHSQFRDHRP